MDEACAKPAGRNWARIAWITLAGFLAVFTGTAVFLSGADSTPTVYHRADGTFSLNRLDGPSTTPEALRELLKNYDRFGRVRLVCNPQTKFGDWNPYLNAGSEAGAPYYQLEAGGKVYAFSIPGWCYYHEHDHVINPSLQVVNLSGNDESPPLDMALECEVAIWIDPLTTCEEALTAAQEFKEKHKTISIICDPESDESLAMSRQYLNFKRLYMNQTHRPQSLFGDTYLISRHSLSSSQRMVQEQYGEQSVWLEQHREIHCGRRSTDDFTFRLKRSKFWTDHIQPVLDQIKAIF